MFSVLIVADYKVRSNCLSDFGWKEDEYTVVGCATNAREIVKCCVEKKPDVMLICQNANSVLEIGAIKKVKSLNKQIYIVLVSVGRADNKIINMLKCGVDGYLIYREGAENIPAMLEKMHNRSKSIHDFCVGVDQKLLTDKKLNANYYRKIHFTEREKAVLTFVIEGASNIEIAKCLGISPGRVRNIVADLMTKCMVKNRTQLAVLAVRLGLLEY